VNGGIIGTCLGNVTDIVSETKNTFQINWMPKEESSKYLKKEGEML